QTLRTKCRCMGEHREPERNDKSKTRPELQIDLSTVRPACAWKGKQNLGRAFNHISRSRFTKWKDKESESFPTAQILTPECLHLILRDPTCRSARQPVHPLRWSSTDRLPCGSPTTPLGNRSQPESFRTVR